MGNQYELDYRSNGQETHDDFPAEDYVNEEVSLEVQVGRNVKLRVDWEARDGTKIARAASAGTVIDGPDYDGDYNILFESLPDRMDLWLKPEELEVIYKCDCGNDGTNRLNNIMFLRREGE